MATKETSTNPSVPGFDLAPLFQLGQKQVSSLIEAQRELSSSIEQANRDWLARAKAEQDFTAECTTKLMAAKSFPEAANVYQEWISRRMATMADDNQKLLQDAQKLMASLGKLLWSGGPGIST